STAPHSRTVPTGTWPPSDPGNRSMSWPWPGSPSPSGTCSDLYLSLHRAASGRTLTGMPQSRCTPPVQRSMITANEHICVVIGRTRHKMVQIEIQEAAKQGAQFIELRLDWLAKAPDFKRLLDNKPCPLVCTVRRAADGGRWNGTEDARLMLLRQAIVAGFDWVDLEPDIADSIRRFKDVTRVVS